MTENLKREISIKTNAKEINNKQKDLKKGSFKKILIRITFGVLLVCCVFSFTLVILAGEQINRVICNIPEYQNILTNYCSNSTNDEVLNENNSNGTRFSVETNDIENEESLLKEFDVSDVFEEANESVVGIGIEGDLEEQNVIGSGFVISSDGLIATNQHVVSDLDSEYFVKFPNREEAIDVVEIFRDEVNDLAILRVNETNLNALVLGNSDNLKPGQVVVAIGNPLGDLTSTVTSGIISGLKRTVEVGSSFLRTDVNTFEDTIQTDAAINPGNSGGPLLNDRAEVIGINFATLQGADNLSFAIPVSYLRTRINELNEFGKFRIPYIGIEYTMGQYILDDRIIYGARIQRVDTEGSAVNILQRGDVIIEFNGEGFENESLFKKIQTTEIGNSVELTVIRNGEIVNLDVEIIER